MHIYTGMSLHNLLTIYYIQLKVEVLTLLFSTLDTHGAVMFKAFKISPAGSVRCPCMGFPRYCSGFLASEFKLMPCTVVIGLSGHESRRMDVAKVVDDCFVNTVHHSSNSFYL
jgi:hypothetical protein